MKKLNSNPAHINYDILLHPLVTEKTNMFAESSQYGFVVNIAATKPQIKTAVEKIFNVKVEAVNTLVRKGKNKVFKGRRGRQSDIKKAYVRLADGQRIDIASGV
jgi:large subunit ribosomal protein L23